MTRHNGTVTLANIETKKNCNRGTDLDGQQNQRRIQTGGVGGSVEPPFDSKFLFNGQFG